MFPGSVSGVRRSLVSLSSLVESVGSGFLAPKVRPQFSQGPSPLDTEEDNKPQRGEVIKDRNPLLRTVGARLQNYLSRGVAPG